MCTHVEHDTRPTATDRRMWSRPWDMREGFAIACGIMTAGLMLELSVGPVAWQLTAWPVNIVLMAVTVAAAVAMALARDRVYAFGFMATVQAAIPALACATAQTVIMGLTRQTVGGRWINDMLSFWPFVLTYIYMALMLGVATVHRLRRFSWRRDTPFVLNHAGLFIVMTAATLGNADMQRLKMMTHTDAPEWCAMDEQGHTRELPLAIELRRFIMEQYDDGTPRRFASDIQIYTKSGQNIATTVDVNKPVEVEGWKIYQYGYDTKMGAMSQVSILELVCDPWLPVVYTGIYMMLAGALCMFISYGRRKT